MSLHMLHTVVPPISKRKGNVNTITAYRGKRGIAPLIHMETNGQDHIQAALPSEKVHLVPIHSTVHNVSILTTPSILLPFPALYTMSVY